MPVITFKAEPFKIGSWNVLELPKSASAKLPSRGLVMVKGTINGAPLLTALEPDGKGSHWFKLDKPTKAPLTLAIEPTKDWPEPQVPADIKKGLAAVPRAHDLWQKITPMARWEWIRWIRATNNQETRQRRIEVACSKLKSGMRRPCCFNASMCTEPSVSKNGVLLGPS
jgi:hypothetical protein